MSKSPSYFQAVTFCLLHLVLKILFHFGSKVGTFHVKTLLHFGSKVVTFHIKTLIHFGSKGVTFRVNVTFCVNCYILQHNTSPSKNPALSGIY